ncbi:MAG: VanZ family protein [Methylovulum sp.]|nr:VanZ family protein [Methylovulum sp.]
MQGTRNEAVPATAYRFGVRNGLFVLAALLIIASLFIGGAQPEAVGLIQAPWDKLAHATIFFLLALLLVLGFVLPIWLIVGISFVVGVADELHQIWLPGRSADIMDWLCDAGGVLLAMLVLQLVRMFAAAVAARRNIMLR